MDRQIIYVDAIPLDTDQLLQSKNTMIGLGMALQAILGTGTLFDGLACTPTGPASLDVLVGSGSIYSIQNVDGTAYGSVAADTTHQIVKQGISLSTLTLACPAPTTTGQSINYLIQAAYQDTDAGSTTLPYYNSDNPDVAFNGPNNTGVSQNTVREGQCTVAVKAGIAATTGSQATPAADAGYTGLWVVTVANGQASITSGNIAQVSGAPFISEKLNSKIGIATGDLRYSKITDVQNNAINFANDTSGTANTITATLTPAPTAYVKGMNVTINIANTNNGSSVVNLNGLGNKSITLNGSALVGGELVASRNAVLSYNGTAFELTSSTPSNVIPVGPVRGSARKFASAWASNTTVNITCDEIILEDSSGNGVKASAVNVTASTGSVGANALDAGSVAISTWYYTYLIYNSTASTLSGLISTSSTTPTLPSGYTFKARVGAFRTDGSGNIVGFMQKGRIARYIVGNNLTGLPNIASGSAGSVSAPTWVAVAISSVVPPTAASIAVMTCVTAAGAGSTLILAPNNSYGSATSSNPPFSAAGVTNASSNGAVFDLGIESTNIYWANSGGTPALYCYGWEDNL